jgi:cation diffusion facilitator family transporter
VLGGRLGIPQLYYLDPAAGVFVSVLVLKMGFKLVMESIHSTMDHVLHQEDADELLQTVQRVPGVIAVDDLRAREHGHYVIVDVKISVNPQITVLEGHDIAKSVKHQLMTRFIHVSDVFIHVNPYDPGYPYKNNVNSKEGDLPTLLH